VYRAKTYFLAVSWGWADRSCGLVVLVDHATQYPSSMDRCVDRDNHVAEHGAGVLFTVDQNLVGALGPDAATNRSAKLFAPGVLGGVFTTSMPSPANTASKVSVNFASRSRMKNRHRHARSPSSSSGCGPAGWSTRRSGGDFHDEQNVQAARRDGVEVDEVSRQQPGRLSPQERAPAGVGLPWGGTDPGSGEDAADELGTARFLATFLPDPEQASAVVVEPHVASYRRRTRTGRPPRSAPAAGR
jgi:hypothetical protein